MNYKVTKGQMVHYFEFFNENKVHLTESKLDYETFFNNIVQVLKDLVGDPITKKKYDFFENNFDINRAKLISLLKKKNIINIENEKVNVIAKDIQHNIKRLYQYLTDSKEARKIDEETGCGAASGAFETPAFSTPIKRQIEEETSFSTAGNFSYDKSSYFGNEMKQEKNKTWKDGKFVEFKPECVKYGNNIHCDLGGGNNSPLKDKSKKA